MTDEELEAFYRRYNAYCNEHRFDEFGAFVAGDVVINHAERGLDAYTGGLRAVVAGFPDFRWELRHLVIDAPWIAAHLTDTGTHRGTFQGVAPTGRPVTDGGVRLLPHRGRPDRRGVGHVLRRAAARPAPVTRAPQQPMWRIGSQIPPSRMMIPCDVAIGAAGR